MGPVWVGVGVEEDDADDVEIVVVIVVRTPNPIRRMSGHCTCSKRKIE
jgi:hypothetical protein